MRESAASVLAFLDLQFFLFLNHLPHTWVTDTLALAISGVGAGGALFLLIGFLLFIREEVKDHKFLFQIVSTLITTWILVEGILKPWIAKPRPHLTGPWGYAYIVDTTVTGYSFPSAHAAFAFGLAVILANKEPRWKRVVYIGATLIALSRVYLGVHFPIDILVGALLGWGIGNVFLWAFNARRITQKQLLVRSYTNRKRQRSAFSRRSKTSSR